MQKVRESTRDEARGKMRELAARIEKASCTIPVKTGDDGKMYGSVSANDIVEALKAQGVELERNCLVMEHPIKELGVFDIKVTLPPDVETVVKIWVVEE
jgi:large subunit ribosomal protein L9